MWVHQVSDDCNHASQDDQANSAYLEDSEGLAQSQSEPGVYGVEQYHENKARSRDSLEQQ
jgi:hypothetical protein